MVCPRCFVADHALDGFIGPRINDSAVQYIGPNNGLQKMKSFLFLIQIKLWS